MPISRKKISEKKMPAASRSSSNENHIVISRHGAEGDVFVVRIIKGDNPKEDYEHGYIDGLATALYGKEARNGVPAQPKSAELNAALKKANFMPYRDGCCYERKSMQSNEVFTVQGSNGKNYGARVCVFIRTIEDGSNASVVDDPEDDTSTVIGETGIDDRDHNALCIDLRNAIVEELERQDQPKVQSGKLRSMPVYAHFSEKNDLSREINEKGDFEPLDRVLTDNYVAPIVRLIYSEHPEDKCSPENLLMYSEHKDARLLFSKLGDQGVNGYSALAITEFGFPASSNTDKNVVGNRLKQIAIGFNKLSDEEKKTHGSKLLASVRDYLLGPGKAVECSVSGLSELKKLIAEAKKYDYLETQYNELFRIHEELTGKKKPEGDIGNPVTGRDDKKRKRDDKGDKDDEHSSKSGEDNFSRSVTYTQQL